MAVAPGGAAFRDVERSYFDLRWHFDPVAASQAGGFAQDHPYGRYTPAGLRPHLAGLKALGNALEEARADDPDAENDRPAPPEQVRGTMPRFEEGRPPAQ